MHILYFELNLLVSLEDENHGSVLHLKKTAEALSLVLICRSSFMCIEHYRLSVEKKQLRMTSTFLEAEF